MRFLPWRSFYINEGERKETDECVMWYSIVTNAMKKILLSRVWKERDGCLWEKFFPKMLPFLRGLNEESKLVAQYPGATSWGQWTDRQHTGLSALLPHLPKWRTQHSRHRPLSLLVWHSQPLWSKDTLPILWRGPVWRNHFISTDLLTTWMNNLRRRSFSLSQAFKQLPP